MDDEPSTTPFDDFPGRQNRSRRLHLAPIAKALRAASAIALGFAVATAVGVIVLDALHLVRPDIPWKVKSALPLVGIGVSYALLQFTLPRTWTELGLSLAVSLAFVLWGAEQFIPAPRIASLVDDVVVFLFVLDLGVGIRGQLRRHIRRERNRLDTFLAARETFPPNEGRNDPRRAPRDD